MGKAIEIELALKQQADFEKELQGLFFASNNMDIWQNIMKRVQEMNAADADEARKESIAEAKRKRRQQEINEIIVVVGVIIVVFILVGFSIFHAIDFCKTNRCG